MEVSSNNINMKRKTMAEKEQANYYTEERESRKRLNSDFTDQTDKKEYKPSNFMPEKKKNWLSTVYKEDDTIQKLENQESFKVNLDLSSYKNNPYGLELIRLKRENINLRKDNIRLVNEKDKARKRLRKTKEAVKQKEEQRQQIETKIVDKLEKKYDNLESTYKEQNKIAKDIVSANKQVLKENKTKNVSVENLKLKLERIRRTFNRISK